MGVGPPPLLQLQGQGHMLGPLLPPDHEAEAQKLSSTHGGLGYHVHHSTGKLMTSI